MSNYQRVRCPKCHEVFENKGGHASAVDWTHAKQLRNQYWSLKEIGAKFGVSSRAISAGFKLRGIK